MTRQPKEQRVVVVSGDVTMDWNVARVRGTSSRAAEWNTEDTVRASCQRGGAAMLGDLIETVVAALAPIGTGAFIVRQTDAPRQYDSISPGDPRFVHSYAIWSAYKSRDRGPTVPPSAWRVQEFLGVDRPASHDATATAKWHRAADQARDIEVVVVDDAALGFRDDGARWPMAIQSATSNPWVIIKMASPVAHGPLWDHVLATHAERLIVVTTARDLRRTEVQISRALSWERTAQDLVWELRMNPLVNGLSRAAHTIVSFDAAGALLMSRTPSGESEARLFFEPSIVEGEWGASRDGKMIGYTTCLTAGIVRQILLAPPAPNVARGVHTGLRAMRELYLRGYTHDGTPGSAAALRFPIAAVAERLALEEDCVAEARVEDPTHALASGPRSGRDSRLWSILEDHHRGALDLLAERVALRGIESELKGIPIGRFGKLLSVDRRETEGLRSVRALVREYARQGKQKPFSTAVFGAPGAGKSFTVVQLAATVLPDEIEQRTFNLSQMSGPSDLHDALHQVRDIGLTGRMPLVFWDEFDSSPGGQPLGWLRHFLAPMQDGSFQHGQVTHPIGRAIFVFAGGMSHSLDMFMNLLPRKEFVEAKGPDFVSRLKGSLCILGPNPEGGDAHRDPYFVIRRAILLRSIIEREAPRLLRDKGSLRELSIDSGVLRAFLQTREYKHGARSMEAVVATSLLAEASSYERSSLPADSQLEIHVDARDFLARVQQPELSGDLLERLARAAHDVFCESLKDTGHRLGAETSEQNLTHSSLKTFEDLSDEERDQNRQNVRDIPAKLAAAGYLMVPARSGEPAFTFPGHKLEQLAEMEHQRWVRAKLSANWRYAPATQKEARLHEALLPWRRSMRDELIRDYGAAAVGALGDAELPEAEKDKDRVMVRAIPRMLAKIGYTIVERAKNPTEVVRVGEEERHSNATVGFAKLAPVATQSRREMEHTS